jgi:predicted ATPase
MLLVLDNCERVIESAASLAAAILSVAPRVHILATSREPLRAEREHVYRLQRLVSPLPASQLTATEALTFPAVQLFVERVAASVGEFELSPARIHWLQGFPEQAVCAAQSSVEDAHALDHPTSLCYALDWAACPVALFVGDLAAAEHSAATLLDHSARHGLAFWHANGRSFKGALVIRRGDVAAGLQLLRDGLDALGETSFWRHMVFAVELARGLGRAGQAAEGLALIDEALERSERKEERWCVAELLRSKGELLLLESDRKAVAAAEDLFAQSLAWGRRQAALSWELRTSISLARLRRDQGRTEEAHDLLAAVYGRFTEGFETADLLTAKQLLDAPAELGTAYGARLYRPSS